ncbi:MAG: molybdenum cofactor guanylyltransferase [Mailhella sp.]|nr:molybdenum cofactor guanylyltransferase [Mailhella sp.]
MAGVSAILLAGGRSSRFGSDKLRFVPPSCSCDMLQRSFSLLQGLPGVSRVAVSCREEQAGEIASRLPRGAAIVADQPHEQTFPIFGMAAALRKWPGTTLLLSCDLPLMERSVLSILLREHGRRRSGGAQRPLRTAFRHADGRVETLVSVWEPESLPFIERSLAGGRYGLYAAIPPERQWLIPIVDPLPFFNLNTPQDVFFLHEHCRNALPVRSGAELPGPGPCPEGSRQERCDTR